MIDTAVPGRPEEVRAVARGVLRLRLAIVEAQRLQAGARSTARREWEGRAAESYHRLARVVADVGDRHERRAMRAAAVLVELAERLEALQDEMAEVRARAAAGGLTVRGALVEPPSGAGTEPAQRRLWTELAGQAARAHADHRVWVDGRVVPLAGAQDDTASLLAALRERAAPFLVTAGTTLGTRRFAEMAEQAAPRDADLAAVARRAGRVLGPVGTALDVVVAADNVRDGASPSQTIATTGAAMGGAAVAVALAPALPALGVAVVAGGAALGASAAAGYVWRHLPDEVTDDLDDALEEVWDDGAQAAGELTDELVDGGRELVSDVRGWFR